MSHLVLLRSIDYGYTFNNDNTKVNTAVLDYYYINPHDKMKVISKEFCTIHCIKRRHRYLLKLCIARNLFAFVF